MSLHRSRFHVRVIAALALVPALMGVLAPVSSATTSTFEYTGAAETWTAPAGATSATFDVYGAAGSAFSNAGPPDRGGRATATIPVTPLQAVAVYVGGSGTESSADGGFNGGGTSNRFPGGGASDVRVGGSTLTDRAIVAGGGAGGTTNCTRPDVHPGVGGGLVGGDGFYNPVCFSLFGALPGTGGTQTQGGTNPGDPGAAGGLGLGGRSLDGGGGGGGFYGGAGGHNTGEGGGGSGFGPSGVAFQSGVRDGDGLVTVTPHFPVQVAIAGSGTGRVSSSPVGIDCQSGSTSGCSTDFAGAEVTLSASADSGSSFAGWDGAGCSGTSDCVVIGDAVTAVRATFALDEVIPPPADPPAAPPAAVVPLAPAPVILSPPGPVISDLGVDRRCVRAATLSGIAAASSGLSFTFSLSQDATVRYEIVRRVDSPKRTRCPKPGGTAPVRFSDVWSDSDLEPSGKHQTSLATAASLRGRGDARGLRGRVAFREGRRRLSLRRVATGRKLTVGSYLLRVTASNAAGASKTAAVQFWVLAPRR